MPSIVTHHLFAEEVYTHLSTETQNKIKPAYSIYQILPKALIIFFTINFLPHGKAEKLDH